ncbi:formylmethanofuran--tetrahydromethanopterin N-formyltransferase [Acetomicrobium sp.]|uniref:formylmethanofuran--tetrahydromethanopterin N-formyltransferase n=1 Tax=Acetomicrobium TaxID=49894 RepID=UPI002870BD53|nr:formylmethanofuran--tetrahydromethanopterin N-formyltransferase [Acetomicrobium sp.]MDR9769482.1 formylmethanofuran--tetrahydromethanopterin N-formyltransferase [Acetomicrobium sp.]HOP88253.1 formylmethanofuran--tetrahydromethanopterin N-formyltransferase [Acetomicrobium flavidum]HPP14551.1 formylmethanofuran--tetrahydromethanopterin N-formyltransferase [Acetomicrobium flavidum]HPU69258.1 formylmethanofuran--tetrahydromethanopterin N-formyltransferase [Acetomicrobium flavidum]
MIYNGVEIEDTYAEAFSMWGSRIVVTADTREWVMTAAASATGFATSVIGCGCEAGVESELDESQTPDGRPGASILIFGVSRSGLESQLISRIGQSIMTCPTTACYNGLDDGEQVDVGGKLKFFGDSYQSSKMLGNRRFWRIPVMDGEFLVEQKFCIKKGVGGGNLLIISKDVKSGLEAAQRAVGAMKKVPGAIMPFPGGVVRSGSKVGSTYRFLSASTNTPYCPTLKRLVKTSLPEEANAVYEIVIDGLDERSVRDAMGRGLLAACSCDILSVTAGNYGGNLGQYKFYLLEILKNM